MKIWKFQFSIQDRVGLRMPTGARILSLQMQGLYPTIWAMCDPDEKAEVRNFRIYGTGHECDSPAENFVGTVQCHNGLVFHVFTD